MGPSQCVLIRHDVLNLLGSYYRRMGLCGLYLVRLGHGTLIHAKHLPAHGSTDVPTGLMWSRSSLKLFGWSPSPLQLLGEIQDNHFPVSPNPLFEDMTLSYESREVFKFPELGPQSCNTYISTLLHLISYTAQRFSATFCRRHADLPVLERRSIPSRMWDMTPKTYIKKANVGWNIQATFRF